MQWNGFAKRRKSDLGERSLDRDIEGPRDSSGQAICVNADDDGARSLFDS
ncbi:MAG: hypothetical protein ACJA1R_000730, partial [Flavobacteriales bacterium]